MIIAKVCVNVASNAIDKNYTYRVPDDLKFLTAGWRVLISFGRQRVDGFVIGVLEVDDATKFEFVLKEER